MEIVEVVIRIPKEVYENIQKIDRIIAGRRNGKTIEFALLNGVKNGAVLPKGHGDLKDANYMKREGIINRGNYNSIKGVREWIDEAPTVIEADKEVQDEK